MDNNLDVIHEFADLGDVILHYVVSGKGRRGLVARIAANLVGMATCNSCSGKKSYCDST